MGEGRIARGDASGAARGTLGAMFHGTGRNFPLIQEMLTYVYARGRLAAFGPLPRAHLVRSGGCLAPHRTRRATLVSTARQQGVDGDAASSGAARWHWARLRKRVFVLALAPWPVCQQGALRLIAASTHGQVIQQILRPLQRCAAPPPITPARACHATVAGASP